MVPFLQQKVGAKKLIVYIRRDGGQSQYSPYLAAGPKERPAP